MNAKTIIILILVAVSTACTTDPDDPGGMAGLTETGTGGDGDMDGDMVGDGDGDCDLYEVDPSAGDNDDGRLHIVEVSADGAGRWEGVDLWSPVVQWDAVAQMVEVESEWLWACVDVVDADRCVVVDTAGHVGCFRHEPIFGVAVAVAPSCALEGDGWIGVGNGMVAYVYI